MNKVSRILSVAVHGFGAVAFAYPFFTGELARAGEKSSHAADAPFFFAILGVLLVALAVADVRTGRLGAKEIALLGVLAGLNAVLRLPGALAGGSLMFFLPIMCGAVFGARFGFLLGASSMATSALITGGAGPWLPFQMWALGWAGAGGALARPLVRRYGFDVRTIAALAVYGWISGLLFGALANLWFWPFLKADSAIAWSPNAGAAANMVRYARFYLVTSLAWDSGRAIVNAVLIVALGRPVGSLLERFRARLEVSWDPEPVAAGRATIQA